MKVFWVTELMAKLPNLKLEGSRFVPPALAVILVSLNKTLLQYYLSSPRRRLEKSINGNFYSQIIMFQTLILRF